MRSTNPKAMAWDKVGGLFWSHGRTSARPSQLELDLFTQKVAPGDKVCVVGASTRELVDALIDLKAKVTVLDFSSQMCDDLGAVVEGAEIYTVDITESLPNRLLGQHKYVMCDRLVNRFDLAEAARGVDGMVSLLQPGGTLVASVKLGLYPMDLRMIEHAQESGTLDSFWDEKTTSIDFSSAGSSLEKGVLPHGNIDPNTLKEWYRGRGVEKRFSDREVRDLLTNGQLSVEDVLPLPDAPETNMYFAHLSN